MASIDRTHDIVHLRHSPLSLFVAGALAVLVFHQGALTMLHALGYGGAPFPVTATQPLEIPAIWSLAFWGALWGLVLAFSLTRRALPGGKTPVENELQANHSTGERP